jgi:hypothetical protein
MSLDQFKNMTEAYKNGSHGCSLVAINLVGRKGHNQGADSKLQAKYTYHVAANPHLENKGNFSSEDP